MEIRRTRPGNIWITEGYRVLALSVSDLACELGVTVQTIGRWCRGDPIPKCAELAMRHLMGLFHNPIWTGFHIGDDGRLWLTNGYNFQPAELEAWSLVYDTNESLWRRVRALEKKQQAVDEAPPVQRNPLPADYHPKQTRNRM